MLSQSSYCESLCMLPSYSSVSYPKQFFAKGVGVNICSLVRFLLIPSLTSWRKLTLLILTSAGNVTLGISVLRSVAKRVITKESEGRKGGRRGWKGKGSWSEGAHRWKVKVQDRKRIKVKSNMSYHEYMTRILLRGAKSGLCSGTVVSGRHYV